MLLDPVLATSPGRALLLAGWLVAGWWLCEVMNWALLDFYQKEVDADEYLGYLHHHVRMIPWIEDKDNRARIEGVITAACL